MANLHTYLNLDTQVKIRLDDEEHKKGENVYLDYVASWLLFKATGNTVDESLELLKKQIENCPESHWDVI